MTSMRNPEKSSRAIPGLKMVEMERNHIRSFCCGAGGGRMWMEEKLGTRINQERTDQALKTQAQMVGTACPYCLTMLGDGIKEKGLEEILDGGRPGRIGGTVPGKTAGGREEIGAKGSRISRKKIDDIDSSALTGADGSVRKDL